MNTAIINNNGIGNGIIIYPILKSLEKFEKFIHIENLFLETKKENLENLIEFFPKEWRRFENIDTILKHFEDLHIGKIINIRKEAKNYDTKYFKFKKVAKKHVDIFDLYQNNIDNSNPIGIQCKQVFENAYGKIKNIDWKWLEPKLEKEQDILFYIGSSILEKVLSLNQVIKIHESIRDRIPKSKILICSGNNRYEKDLLKELSNNLIDERTSFYNFNNLPEAESQVAKSDIILTNDSYMSHLGGASYSPTYTIFLRTNGIIWRNSTQPLNHIFQSNIPLNCDSMKEDGTCKNFYNNCGGCRGQDIDFEKIGYIIADHINIIGNQND